MQLVRERFQKYLGTSSSTYVQRLACFSSESQADPGPEHESSSTSMEKPSGGGRKRNHMKIMERIGMTPAAQSLIQGRKGHRKPAFKPPAPQPGAEKLEDTSELIDVPLGVPDEIEDGFTGKGVPLSEEQIKSLLGQLDAVESKAGPSEGSPQVLDSKDPSIDYVEVVSEIRALSSHKTTVKWLGKRKAVTSQEMEGVDCSRDYDFPRGAFESPDQAKFKKRGDNDT